MTELNIAHTFTQKVIRDYKDKGFRLFLEPKGYPDEVPMQIRNFRPDIVAISDDEKIIIEVVRNLNSKKLNVIQNFIESIEGTEWQVKVINISDSDNFNE